MKISFLNPDKGTYIERMLKGEKDRDEAIVMALAFHFHPLHFNELRGLLPESMKHGEKIIRSLRRLMRQKIVRRVVFKGVNTPWWVYTLNADMPNLIRHVLYTMKLDMDSYVSLRRYLTDFGKSNRVEVSDEHLHAFWEQLKAYAGAWVNGRRWRSGAGG